MTTIPHRKTVINYGKRLFQPVNIVPNLKAGKKSELTKCHRLMLDMGIIKQCSNGVFSLLPLGLRALNKLKAIIDFHMIEIGAQEIQMPIMVDSSIWKASGRWNTTGLELIKLKDRHGKDYLLGPTHEESVADLLASCPLSYQQLPLLLYQTTMKFRDEIKPRCGFLKSREFLMKDLYSFDSTFSSAENIYKVISETYEKIFKELNLPYYRVTGGVDDMGGVSSHEFHIPSEIGEDSLVVCQQCNTASISIQNETCSSCGHKSLKNVKGIEIGHTFLLGTKYSEPLKAYFKDKDNTEKPMIMGSYGLGLTRILTASIEYLSLEDQIRWPTCLSPFTIVIITPKDGSKEAKTVKGLGLDLYEKLSENPKLSGDILLDDRGHFTIGKRLIHAKQTGYPHIIVIGLTATTTNPRIELHSCFDNMIRYLTVPELLHYFNCSPHDRVIRKTS